MKPDLDLIKACPLCGSEKLDPIFSCTDHLVSKEQFAIVGCANCGLRLTSPRPSEKDIGSFYRSEAYVSHSGTSRGIINSLYHLVRSYTLRQKFKLIRKFSTGGRILDYGAGSGEFLAYMKNRGYEVVGLEPDSDARIQAIEKNGIELFEPRALDSKNNKAGFNIITMWHVLEHIHQPMLLLRSLINHLAEEGVLIIAVPNYRSEDARIYGSDWAAYDVPRHLFHFTRNTMSDMGSQCGLELKKVVPMYFDAYYVSMLSEKNKGTGIVGIIRGSISGSRSNLSARLKTGEYSSLIYVFGRNKP